MANSLQSVVRLAYALLFPGGDQAARIINSWSRTKFSGPATSEDADSDEDRRTPEGLRSSTNSDATLTTTSNVNDADAEEIVSGVSNSYETASQSGSAESTSIEKSTGWGFINWLARWRLRRRSLKSEETVSWSGSDSYPSRNENSTDSRLDERRGRWPLIWEKIRWKSVRLPASWFERLLIVLLIASTILFVMLLAGCTTKGLEHIYILSLSYTNSSIATRDSYQINPNISAFIIGLTQNTTGLEIRIGYFGFCLIDSLGPTTCSPSMSSLASSVRESGVSSDPLNLLAMAGNFKSSTIFSGLILICIILEFAAIALLSKFPRWVIEDGGTEDSEHEIKEFPSRPVAMATLVCIIIASLCALLSAFWQHLSAGATVSMMKSFSYGASSAHVGAIAMILGWLGAGLSALALMGMSLHIASIIVLAQLAWSDGSSSGPTSLIESKIPPPYDGRIPQRRRGWFSGPAPPAAVEPEPIKFKDAIGRKYSFPWRIASDWDTMEDLINQTFAHIDGVGPHVRQGHYDLEGPEGETIHKPIWNETVQPGWQITMKMWPLAQHPIRRGSHHPIPVPPNPPPEHREAWARRMMQERAAEQRKRETGRSALFGDGPPVEQSSSKKRGQPIPGPGYTQHVPHLGDVRYSGLRESVPQPQPPWPSWPGGPPPPPPPPPQDHGPWASGAMPT